jgi:16S rRNA processing protein RimM
MNKAETTYITIGKFGATHGVHGWIRVNAYTEFAENILNYTPWYVKRLQQDWSILPIESSKFFNDTLLVKVANINSPEEARLLTGLTIAVTRTQLPALGQDEYYWSDLIGLRVITLAGNDLGTVTHLMATGSNDVLVVKGQKEHAIPYLIGSVIKKIDLKKQEILVDWELI